MSTDVAVPAVGLAISPSSLSSMPHHRIFLDYTSLFSDNYKLLRQFSLYASEVLRSPRLSMTP
uniref:Uncharacterized protein n=1 Tax=Oryza punctata TaxID=4537 RepID=A0A0E0LLT2_ORYPU